MPRARRGHSGAFMANCTIDETPFPTSNVGPCSRLLEVVAIDLGDPDGSVAHPYPALDHQGEDSRICSSRSAPML